MSIEKRLHVLNWNPHTCDCKLTYSKETTRRLLPRIVPFGSGDSVRLVEQYGEYVGRLRLLVDDDDRVMVHVPVYETEFEELGKAPWRCSHELAEMMVSPGVRVRARINRRCLLHQTFEPGSMRMQHATVPVVCKCLWMELCHETGANEDTWSVFGRRMNRLCLEHAESHREHLAEIPSLIFAAAKAYSAEQEKRKAAADQIRYDRLGDGRIAHVFRHDGRLYRTIMEPVEEPVEV